jgi:hypothetical protein
VVVRLIKEQMPALCVSQPKQMAVWCGRGMGMKDFGGRVDGGVYDYARHTENVWLSSQALDEGRLASPAGTPGAS